jgi:hypothetical protein
VVDVHFVLGSIVLQDVTQSVSRQSVVHGMYEVDVGTVVGQPQGTETEMRRRQAYREHRFVGVAVAGQEVEG